MLRREFFKAFGIMIPAVTCVSLNELINNAIEHANDIHNYRHLVKMQSEMTQLCNDVGTPLMGR